MEECDSFSNLILVGEKDLFYKFITIEFTLEWLFELFFIKKLVLD